MLHVLGCTGQGGQGFSAVQAQSTERGVESASCFQGCVLLQQLYVLFAALALCCGPSMRGAALVTVAAQHAQRVGIYIFRADELLLFVWQWFVVRHCAANTGKPPPGGLSPEESVGGFTAAGSGSACGCTCCVWFSHT